MGNTVRRTLSAALIGLAAIVWLHVVPGGPRQIYHRE